MMNAEFVKRACRWIVCVLILVTLAREGSCQVADKRVRAGEVLFADDFKHGLDDWRIEMEKPGSVSAKDGVLDIDVSAGVTLWFRRKLDGPVMISYEDDCDFGWWSERSGERFELLLDGDRSGFA